MINKEKKYNINLFDLIEKDINENLELYFEKILEMGDELSHFPSNGLIYFNLINRSLNISSVFPYFHSLPERNFSVSFLKDSIEIKFLFSLKKFMIQKSISSLKIDLDDALIEIKKSYLNENKNLKNIIFNIDNIEDIVNRSEIPALSIFHKEEFEEEFDKFINKSINKFKNNTLNFEELRKILMFFFKNEYSIKLIYSNKNNFNQIYFDFMIDIFIRIYSFDDIKTKNISIYGMKYDITNIFVLNDPIMLIKRLLDEKLNKHILLIMLEFLYEDSEDYFEQKIDVDYKKINEIIKSKFSNKYFYLDKTEQNFIRTLKHFKIKYFTDDKEEYSILKKTKKTKKLISDDFCERKLNFLQEIKKINFSYSKEELDKINSEIEKIKKLSIKNYTIIE